MCNILKTIYAKVTSDFKGKYESGKYESRKILGSARK
jgi:hypothetical protein